MIPGLSVFAAEGACRSCFFPSTALLAGCLLGLDFCASCIMKQESHMLRLKCVRPHQKNFQPSTRVFLGCCSGT